MQLSRELLKLHEYLQCCALLFRHFKSEVWTDKKNLKTQKCAGSIDGSLKVGLGQGLE
jgi:hypothetical protein